MIAQTRAILIAACVIAFTATAQSAAELITGGELRPFDAPSDFHPVNCSPWRTESLVPPANFQAQATNVTFEGATYRVCRYIAFCRTRPEPGRPDNEVRCLSDRPSCPPVYPNNEDLTEHSCLQGNYSDRILQNVLLAARFQDGIGFVPISEDARSVEGPMIHRTPLER